MKTKKKQIIRIAFALLFVIGFAVGFHIYKHPYAKEVYMDLDTILGVARDNVSDKEYETLVKDYYPIWKTSIIRRASGLETYTEEEIAAYQEFIQELEPYTTPIYDSIYEMDKEIYNKKGITSGQELKSALYAKITDTPYPVCKYFLYQGHLIKKDGSPTESYVDMEDYATEEIVKVWEHIEEVLPEEEVQKYSSFLLYSYDRDVSPIQPLTYVEDSEVNNSLLLIYEGLELLDEPSFFVQSTYCAHGYILFRGLDQIDYADEIYLSNQQVLEKAKEESYLKLFMKEFYPDALYEEYILCGGSYDYYARHMDSFVAINSAGGPELDMELAFAFYCSMENLEDCATETIQKKVKWFDQFDELKIYRETAQNYLENH